jgi:hypothetical protein
MIFDFDVLRFCRQANEKSKAPPRHLRRVQRRPRNARVIRIYEKSRFAVQTVPVNGHQEMSDYYDEIRQQVLDGKRSWSCRNVDDADDFLTKVVVPLRKMKANGVFDSLAELEWNRRGGSFVARVDIEGAINFDAL